MRTTLTLEDDVAKRLQRLAHARGCSFKEVVNTTLRSGLEAESRRKPKPFRVQARNLRLRAGMQLDKVSDVLELLDAQDASGAGD